MRQAAFLSPIAVFLFTLCAEQSFAATHPYDGQVSHDIKRDRIIAISEDYSSLYYYVGPENIDYSGYSGATCPDPTTGWKTGAKYCWGGEDTTAIYLLRLTEGDGAGNRNTGSSSSFDSYCTGVDCSGMASVCWTSPRRATSGFPGISDDILWENLRMGDCTNLAGSHIRVFDRYAGDAGTIVFYESTSGGGRLWKCVHRSLSRDNSYQPIRYNYTYDVYDFPEPVITCVRRTGVERVEVVWDGQADVGFRLEQSTDGSTWTRVRDTTALTPTMRSCEVSGLLPDTTVYFRMTAVNTGGETIRSSVATVRLTDATPSVLVVDGADRYREQFSSNHAYLTRLGAALGSLGLGFDSCANESVVDELVDLADYHAVVWVLAEESTFDETFSWPEQRHVMNYLAGGGRLFVSGSEIGWDLDYRAGSTTYKNGHANDRTFYNDYLRAGYAGDDAATHNAAGTAGSIFDGLSLTFDDGTHGAYDVASPDQLTVLGGATAGMTYQGGSGGTACVYGSALDKGTVVNLGFGFETIYPDLSRQAVMEVIFRYFDVPVPAPTLKSVVRSSADSVAVSWDGHAGRGYRLFQKTGTGAWIQIRDEATLDAATRSTVIGGLSSATQYGFAVRAVDSRGAGLDSDAGFASMRSSGPTVLVVDGYDRWNDQNSGANHTLLERFADALTANQIAYDTCTNEQVAAGAVALEGYPIVMWMCGEESTESETFSASEQAIVEDYLKAGGKLFVSGAEIGWDLVAKADTANDYSNGSPNDTPFFQTCLKTDYVADDAATYAVSGMPGSSFDGLSFAFDDGTHGTYDVSYPDVIATSGGSQACLRYGTGTSVAGVCYTGTFAGGTASGQVIVFGFPFETIYDAAARAAVMTEVLEYFGFPELGVRGWQCY